MMETDAEEHEVGCDCDKCVCSDCGCNCDSCRVSWDCREEDGCEECGCQKDGENIY